MRYITRHYLSIYPSI